MIAVGAVVLIIVAGALLRLAPPMGADFPLNDGGLFLTMARDLAGNGFAPPATTTFNGLGAPFAYPPGAFYLLGALEQFGWAGIDVLRWLPALLSIATIPVVFGIGRAIFRSDGMGVATAGFFAVSTGSYEWLVMGGGITRAPGFLFALGAVLCAIYAYRDGGRGWIVGAGALLGATGLWHPQAAVFAGLSVILLAVFVQDQLRSGTRQLAAMAMIGAVAVLPWLVLILARQGVDPLVSAVSSGGTPLVGLLNVISSHSSGGELEVLGIATTVALVLCAVRRFWLPLVWVVAIAALDSRAGQPYLALPAAMAVAFALQDLGHMLDRGTEPRSIASAGPGVWHRLPAAIGLILALGSFGDSLLAQASPASPMRAIGPDARSAMAWVSVNTDPGARFAVVSGRYWAVDGEAEWFPVLAGRESVSTVQGTEWLGRDRFLQQVELASRLPVCIVDEDRVCVEEWFASAGEVDHLFLVDTPPGAIGGFTCCRGLPALLSAAAPQVVHQEGSVLIVRLATPAG